MLTETPNPARLLVVDDQEANLAAIGEMLGDHGFEIVLARSGAQALQEMEARPADLILLDVIMPGSDGFEVCRRLRERTEWANVPIIFLSAAAETDLVVRALESGGADYVTKPFNRAELLARVRTHLALKSARDQMRQLAEDKDELLGILAHDLKNHLGGMQLTVQLLYDRARAQHAPGLERLAENVLYSTEQMLAFVKEFLANAAADGGLRLSPEPICLHAAATSAVKLYAEAAQRKKIALRYEGKPNGTVAADPRALDQVLDNLISNAIKFTPPEREIRVRVGHDAGGRGAFWIEDEGPGFTEEDRQRMFRRYGRLSARPTGGEPSTGLGLSIVRRLVVDMGGEIRCESDPGKGAVFVVSLPPASLK